MTLKMTKERKCPDFYRFYASFVEFLIDFVDYKVGNVHQGNNLLSSSFYEAIYAVF